MIIFNLTTKLSYTVVSKWCFVHVNVANSAEKSKEEIIDAINTQTKSVWEWTSLKTFTSINP